MKAYQIQFTLPVDNPVNNIRRIIKGQVVHFEVPINTPDIETIGYAFLSEHAKDVEKPALSTKLKNKTGLKELVQPS